MSLFNRNAYQTEIDIVDHFSSDPETSFLSRWVGGLIVPLMISNYALGFITEEQADISGFNIYGRTAVIFGVAWLGGAFFVHFHYFWTSFRALCGLADFGKILSTITIIGSLGYVLWSLFYNWF